MHELSVVSSMVDLLLEEIQKKKIKKVSTVYLLVGDMSGVKEDSIKYYFKLLGKNTPLENSRLSFKYKKSKFRCKRCNVLYEKQDFDMLCPHCNGNGEIREPCTFFYIESIEVEE